LGGGQSKVKVLMFLGDHIVDARAVFAPAVLDNSKRMLRASAVKMPADGEQWLKT
jgi:hypothetical protein